MIESTSHPSLVSPTPRDLSRSADHTSLHRGLYLESREWQTLSGADRHLARMLAAQRSATRPVVFSHVSAAVLLGLPIYGSLGAAVHTLSPAGGASHSSTCVTRHRAALPEADIVSIAGLRCTSPERTLLDLARFLSAETSLSAIDGFLRQEFKVDHRVDWDSHWQWRAEFEARLAGLRGERGVRRARRVLELADPRSDSVLESVSHLRLRQLGFEVDLQVPIRAPHGGSYYVDFEFLGLDLFGECDGKAKYLRAEMRSGRSAEEIVHREKRRHDWICGTTKKNLIRWEYVDVTTLTAFARRLHAFGVRTPRLPG